jgi:DNA repair exonuclease SbcCD ATPase subunit/DNA repair exonuclease SbcCD nuclease subunit
MIKILHISDIHIRNNERFDEYEEIFNKLYLKIEEEKPEIIVIAGDLFDNFIEISNEAKVFASDFLTKLSTYAEIRIVHGNHDLRKKALTRVNSVLALVKILKNKKIVYFKDCDFYNDKIFKQIIWVNHPYGTKNNNPWRNIIHIKDESKIYISLFHDPVYGCKTAIGEIFDKPDNIPTSEFDNSDYVMLGDIHLIQYFRNKQIAYAGSLIQQNHGEHPYGHGGLIWEIEDSKKFNVREFEIKSDINFINFYINQDVDYDNLNFSSPYINDKSIVKVKWIDLAANINNNNETKIKKYIQDKFNIHKIKFDQKKIYNNIISNLSINENLNISDKTVQIDIITEYLKVNGYSEDIITSIINLDNEITSRLNLKDTINNSLWSIDKLWLNNFKSYGDGNEIDWADKNGIIQITGSNRTGKTTILDGITYILYGTTLSTNKLGGAKSEKHGDSRYINYKRDLDYCDGGLILNIDGEKFILERKTERTWDKKKLNITKSSTILTYHNLDGKEMNEEGRAKTQQKLDLVLGEFDDFIRLVLTNADNLNSLLSIDRATFIDSVIKDAGYSIFEKKQSIFSEYKKENTEEKIILDPIETTNKIDELNNEIGNKNIDLNIVTNDLTILDSSYELNVNSKNEKLKLLVPIDESINNLNLDDLSNKINLFNENIINENKSITVYKNKISVLKDTYDEKTLNENYSKIRQIDNFIADQKVYIKEHENSINSNRSEIDRISDKIINAKEKAISILNEKITQFNNDLLNLDKDFVNYLKSYVNDINLNVKELENKINIKNSDKNYIQKEITKLLSDIEELKSSEICPTCKRKYDDDSYLLHIKETIDNKNKLIKQKNKEIDTFSKEIIEIGDEIIIQKNIITDIKNNKFDKYEDILEKYNTLLEDKNKVKSNIEIFKKNIDKVNNDDFSVSKNLETTIISLKENKVKLNDEITVYRGKISDVYEIIREKEKESATINANIRILEIEKEEYSQRQTLLSEIDKIRNKIETYKNSIEKINITFDKYNNQLKYIENNNLINLEIVKLDENIKNFKYDLDKVNIEKNDLVIEIKDIEKELTILNTRLVKYQEQKRKEELFKLYASCVSRDGIPTYLLKKDIFKINNKLEELLSDLDFSALFDDELKLKIYSKKYNNIKSNALEGSGAEKSFIAISLKIALRSINNISKCNFIIFDEIMGKLTENHIDLFILFLNKLKTEIDKIIIIEHVHNVNPDYIIEVIADENEISSFIYR